MVCCFKFILYICNMENEIIQGAAQLFYKENVEGEPLDQDTPFECFHAGAQFVIDAQRKRNKRNIPNESSYNDKKRSMDTYKKITENVEKIICVTGFHITAPGDPSVGINSASWEIKNEFYFDTLEDLEEFRKEIKQLFEFHCGEVTSVITFEEYQAELDAENDELYKSHPVRYLIKDNGNYKQANSTASYSSAVGDGIHMELPEWMRNGSYDDKIIKSTDPEFHEILVKAAGQLEDQIRNEEYRLRNAKRNLRLIRQEFKHGIMKIKKT